MGSYLLYCHLDNSTQAQLLVATPRWRAYLFIYYFFLSRLCLDRSSDFDGEDLPRSSRFESLIFLLLFFLDNLCHFDHLWGRCHKFLCSIEDWVQTEKAKSNSRFADDEGTKWKVRQVYKNTFLLFCLAKMYVTERWKKMPPTTPQKPTLGHHGH